MENTFTAQNLPQQNNPPVAMSTPHHCTLRGNNLQDVIIPDHKVQTKLKSQRGFVINSVLL